MSEGRNIRPLNKSKKNGHLSIVQKFLLLFLIVVALMRILPVVVVLFVGLLPTITLMIIDSKNINKIIVVGCFNLAGVFVYVFNIMQNYTVNNALYIFSNIFNMILMLGSAAVGLLLYYEIPLIFVYLARISNQRRIASIDSRIEKLQKTWGQEISGK